jgi:hypothetical protein
MDIYKHYISTIKNNLSLDKDDWYFKSDSRYRDILEHVGCEHGKQFLSTIKEKYNNVFATHKNYLIELCNLNDLYGKTFKSKFDGFTDCSPTNLRYILHALLIIEYMRRISLNNVNIVEIGGGYGGEALFISKLAPLFNINISSYTIMDLHEASLLAEKYLKAHNINAKTAQLSNCDTLHKNSFLVSNYALSELTLELQKEYVDQVLYPYISHGFLTWNFPHVFAGDFYKKFVADKSVYRVSEFPQTNKRNINSYVYFRPKKEINFARPEE